MQRKCETTHSVGAFEGGAYDAFEHRRHNEEQRVQEDERRIEYRGFGEDKVCFFRHKQMIFRATSETLQASRLLSDTTDERSLGECRKLSQRPYSPSAKHRQSGIIAAEQCDGQRGKSLFEIKRVYADYSGMRTSE